MAACQQQTRKMTAVPLEVKAGGEPGSFEGYGAIFGNLDRDGDIVARGAFADSLKGRLPALLWQHNVKEPIGRFDSVTEDAKGLYVKGRLSMEGRGREAYDLLKMGALDGLSIGFVTQEASRNAHTGTRTITKANLMEISLVTFPANDLARVSSVKSESGSPDTPRDFERFLRESGFSRSRARAITAKGFYIPDHDPVTEVDALVSALEAGRRRLAREVKSRQCLRLLAGPVWSPWERTAAFTATADALVAVSAYSTNPGATKGPFFLKIRHTIPGGRRVISRWQSNGGLSGNGPYPMAEGIQELEISAMAPPAFAQNIVVDIDWAR